MLLQDGSLEGHGTSLISSRHCSLWGHQKKIITFWKNLSVESFHFLFDLNIFLCVSGFLKFSFLLSQTLSLSLSILFHFFYFCFFWTLLLIFRNCCTFKEILFFWRMKAAKTGQASGQKILQSKKKKEVTFLGILIANEMTAQPDERIYVTWDHSVGWIATLSLSV